MTVAQFQLSGQQLLDLAKCCTAGPASIKAGFVIKGDYTEEVLLAAIAVVTDRHDILRTGFVYREGLQIPLQTVYPAMGAGNSCFSATALTLDTPLMVSVGRLASDKLQVTIHALPLILDSYSVNVWYREIMAILNEDTLRVSTADLLQFGDYTSWEAQLIEEGNEEATDFWRKIQYSVAQADGLPGQPADTAAVSQLQVVLNSLPVEQLAATCEVPVKAIFAGLFAQSIARYAAGRQVLIGCLENGRYYEELQHTLGPLSRLYPVCFPELQHAGIRDWAMVAAQQLTEAANWNDYYYAPSNVVLSQLPVQFVMEYADDTAGPATFITTPLAGSLVLRICRLAAGWEITMSYPAGTALAACLFEDLQCRLKDPALPLLHVNRIDNAMITAYNNTRQELPVTGTVAHLILSAFERYPQHIAVKGPADVITYGEMQQRVQHMVTALVTGYGIGRGDVVGVMLDNDITVPLVLAGIIFSGAAYVPLDRNNPADRLSGIIAESNCKLIITDAAIAAWAADSTFASLLVTADALEASGRAAPAVSLVMPSPEDTAYLIFTSGTTGKPKGCQLLHANLLSYISWANGYYFPDAESGNFPLLTNLSFDLTVTSVFTTLTRGRTLYCLNDSWSLTEKLLYCFDPGNNINSIKLTPTHISLLADAVPGQSNISCAIIGGEELRASQVEILRRLSPAIRIYNEYGPTEATVGCIVKEIDPADRVITIGRPVANMEALVLDENQQLLPAGVFGELYLAGNGIAQGYWMQPEMTAAKFPVLSLPVSRRYYRTGDLVRLLSGGDMEFAGRIDDQVKIRGNRIELGDIQAHLSLCPGVDQVIVTVKKDAQEEKYITAYYLAENIIPVAQLQSFLQTRVPAYMIPDFFIAIKEIPLTANGKLDTRMLPDPFAAGNRRQALYVAPVTPSEITITRIWQEVLQLEKIGINDNFYELGGHSLLAMRAVSAIRRELGADIVIRELLAGPSIKQLAALADRKGSSTLLPEVTAAVQKPAHLPLSYAQERLWFIDQLRGSTHYHMPTVFRLSGSLNIPLLEEAFRTVIYRHESLRTVFRAEEGIPYQEILDPGGFQLELSDDIPADLEAAIAAIIDQPFDLSADHMLRARLFRLQATEHLLVLVRHHIAADGWSESLMVQEFTEIYRAGTAKRTAVLPPLLLQYADYALWQRTHLTGEVLEQQISYWEQKLAGVSPLHLPTDFPRPAVQSTRGNRLNFVVDKTLSDRLQLLAQQEGVTPFMLLLAVYNVLLYRYSGQTDICVGTTVAHRPQQELEPLIGFFVNALALRADLSDNPDFKTLLSQVKDTTLEAYAHIAVPFEKVVDRVEKERDKSRSSLFQVLFVLNNNEDASVYQLGDVTVTPESLAHEVAKFDLTFFVQETPAGFSFSINYCSDLFLPATIARMSDHYQQLLMAVADNINIPVGLLGMLPAAEEQALLTTEQPVLSYIAGETVTGLFAAQVARTPDATAFVSGAAQMTYRELDEQSTRLAQYLIQEYRLQANDLVGILMENNGWSLVSILGILKAGAAYVPIDPSLPKDRQEYIIHDTAIKALIITSDNLFEVISFSVPVFSVDLQLEEVTATVTDTPLPAAADLAYVIYTSGTTGHPKGVMITHGNIVDYYDGLMNTTDLLCDRSFGLMSSLSADLGNTVLFGSLLSGGTLHLFSKSLLMNAVALHEYFSRYVIDCIKIVPSHWNALESEGRWLLPQRTIIFGGEALSPAMVTRIHQQAPSVAVINHYGPTETTIGKLLHRVVPGASYSVIPIGRIFSASEVYVVNDQLGLCPVGVSGELLIGGAGVSPGYLHQPTLTAEKFIPHPFRADGGRLYRTGDLVRRDVNGDIIFMGRVDDQVKIRGYRVEPGEVSRVLTGCDAVQQNIVIADTTAGHARLVAYIVPQGTFDKTVLQSYLQERLPDYMIPAVYVPLEVLPLTANGKVDRRALPDPVALEDRTATYVPPRNEPEKKIAAVWSSLLQVEQVGIHDNFFELGGHSLLAVRVLSALKKDAGMEVTITDLFEYVTVATLAAYVSSRERQVVLPAVTVQERPVRIPLSYAQERLWFIDQLRGSTHYHMPTVFRLSGTLNIPLLETAFRTIINRHESLRTVFRAEEGVAYQEILATDGWYLDNGGSISAEELPAAIAEEVARPFDLTKDHMLRARLFRLEENEHELVLVRHHIASDGWSVSLIIAEFTAIYQAHVTGTTAALPVLSLQYADYALWQRHYLAAGLLDRQLEYWEEKLKGISPLQLPTDFPRPAAQSTRGNRLNFVVDKTWSNRLHALARQEGVTPFMLLLAVYKVLLYRYSGQTDICVGTTVAHRPQQELEPLIGFFVNTLTLRADLSDNPDFKTFLLQVKHTTLEAYEHIAVPFEKVVDRVEKQRDKSRSSLFQVLFVLNNNEDAAVHTLGDVVITPQALEDEVAKFDLTFFVQETPAGFSFSINYCSDLFLPATIARMKEHYEHLLMAVAENIDTPVGLLDMLPAAEEQALLTTAQPVLSYTAGETVTGLFAAQVARTPDATAFVSGAAQMTYRELDEQSTKLAQYLIQEYRLQPNDLVGILMENNGWSLVSILGILKAGAAYVPIDPSLPKDRQEYIIHDTAIKALIITSDNLFEVISFSVPVFSVDLQLEEVAATVTDTSLPLPAAADLAYVIYTSGTTGHPKGVMITHGNIVDYYDGLMNTTDLLCDRSFGLMSSLSADLGNTVLFGSLLSGGTLHLFSKSLLMNAVALHEYFSRYVIDCIKIVPSHWNALESEGRWLLPQRTIIFGGEALSPAMVTRIHQQAPSVAVINHYGPTETTIGKLLHRVVPGASYSVIPIGRIFSASEVYVVNDQLGLCPVGVSGELLIGGAGVSPGYLHQPALTAEKFIPHPFRADGGRLYHTGDLVRRDVNGDIIFMGRVDDQVKIRGYRVEPGEVSRVLTGCDAVQQNIVIADTSAGHARLVAYIVPQGTFDKTVLQSYLQERLPDYMIPTVYVPLEVLPLTANGKVDRRALPDPVASENTGTAYIPPRDEAEIVLAEIWASLLNREQVGIHDNFFELGGDSIVVIQVVSRAKRKGYHIQVQDLFDYQTIAGLADMIRENNVAAIIAEQGQLTGSCELSPIQCWFFEEENHHHSYFNQAVLLQLQKGISYAQLQAVTHAVTARHDALRFTYKKVNSVWTQAYGAFAAIPEEVDLRDTTAGDFAAAVTQACRTFQAALDIEKGDLVRFAVIRTPASEEADRLFIAVHHLAIDGVSWRILIDEMQGHLDSLSQGAGELPAEQKTSSYRDWVQALAEHAGTERITAQQPYWENIVHAFRPLPMDTTVQTSVRSHLATVEVELDSTLTNALLREVNHVYNTEINDILLCALAMTVAEWSGQQLVHIGLEGHGREDILPGIDITGTVGWFTNKYPVMLELEKDTSEGNLIKSVKEQLRSIPDKGMGYGCLRYLNGMSSLHANSWDIVFNYLGQLDNIVNNSSWFKGAKEFSGEHISPEYPVRDRFVVKGAIAANVLKITWTYSTEQYHGSTVTKLAADYLAHLIKLIRYCTNKTYKAITPSDFGLNGKIDYKELDNLFGITELEDEEGIIKF